VDFSTRWAVAASLQVIRQKRYVASLVANFVPLDHHIVKGASEVTITSGEDSTSTRMSSLVGRVPIVTPE
jgi:hypothetical protein